MVAFVHVLVCDPGAKIESELAPSFPFQVGREEACCHCDLEITRVQDERGVGAKQTASARVEVVLVGNGGRAEVLLKEGVV